MFNVIYILVLLLAVTSTKAYFGDNPIVPGYLHQAGITNLEQLSKAVNVSFAAPLPGQGKCNNHHLEFCQKEFAKSLGFDISLFSSPGKLENFLKKIYDKPLTEGLILVCAARDSLHTCLGAQYHACTDVFTIMRDHKLGMDDAFKLADIYNDLEFDCNAGLAQCTRHWDCILEHHRNMFYKKPIFECYNQYKRNTEKNPHKYCDYAEDLGFCVAITYQESKCFKKDPMWWECERLLRRARLDGFCPSISCHKVFTEFEEDPDLVNKSYQQQQDNSFVRPEMKQMFKEIDDDHKND